MINPSLLLSDKPLSVKLEKITDNLATLRLPDNQRAQVSVKFLPKDVSAGEVFYLNFLTARELNEGKKETAQMVLKEILEQK